MAVSGDPYEREFEQRLWSEGWTSFRVAGSGTVPHESADIVGIKNGITLVFEVKSVSEDRLPVNVASNSEQLMELQKRMQEGEAETISANLGETHNCRTYFAVKIKEEDSWRYCDWYKQMIPEKGDMERMYKLLNKAD